MKRKGREKVNVTRRSDVEVALKGEVKEFLDRGLKERFERVFDMDEYVEAYFDWFSGLERIGNSSVRKTMERMVFGEGAFEFGCFGGIYGEGRGEVFVGRSESDDSVD